MKENQITIKITINANYKELEEQTIRKFNPKITQKQKYIVKKNENLAEKINGIVRISKNNVPHILKTVKGVTFSICYFYKAKHFKVFYPYNSIKQKIRTYKTEEDIIKFFEDLEKEIKTV